MRRHPKASSAGPTRGSGVRRGIVCFFAFAFLGNGAFSAMAAGPVDSCPNAAIRHEQGSSSLSDCRAYERVSPDPKGGYNSIEVGSRTAAPDGNAINLGLAGPSPDAVGGGVGSNLLATRDPAQGWISHPIDPPFPSGTFYTVYPTIFSTSVNRSMSVVQSFSALTPDGTANADQLYVGSPGSYRLITPQPGLVSPPFPQGALLGMETYVDGSTDDLTTVVYERPVDEFSGSIGTLSTYLWHDGALERVGELNGGVVPSTGTRIGSSPSHGSLVGALSADGLRTFFHVVEPGVNASGSQAGQLYMHEVNGATRNVSSSVRTSPDSAGPLPAFFWAAERQHGNSVIFTSCEKLTDDSTADASADRCSSGAPGADAYFLEGRDLYLYDVDGESLTDLTTQDPGGADVYGVVGTSSDLSKIYFVAGGELDAGAVPGKPNLYLSDEGTISFIATLSSDRPEGIRDSDNWSLSTYSRLSATRVSPDGNALLFVSRARLDSYSNEGTNCLAGSCSEVYLYRRASGVECVSCPPSSATTPMGDAELMSQRNGLRSPDPLPRNLQNDGELVYFQTPQSLTGHDSNGKLDVYQWRNGQMDLMSTGEGNSDSYFAEAGQGGRDVFFISFDRLIGDDVDRQADMYDARVDGGFIEAPPPPPKCAGDDCQGKPSSATTALAAGSSAFQGSGNQTAVRRKHRKHRHGKRGKRNKEAHKHHGTKEIR